MSKSNEANSSQISEVFTGSYTPIRLIVDEVISDDINAVSLPRDAMKKLYLSYGDPIWIKVSLSLVPNSFYLFIYYFS